MLILSTNLFAVEFAKDSWTTNDKGFHAFGSYALCHLIDTKTTLSTPQAAITTFFIGCLWEVQAEAIDYNKSLWFLDSTDHFSFKDLGADAAGIAMYLIGNKFIKNKNKDSIIKNVYLTLNKRLVKAEITIKLRK
jgi:hypothetical protein